MGKRELFACDADSIPDDDANRDDADHNAGSAGLRGLLVRDPYASQLLDGEKIWEIRGRSTDIRGPILIVKSGTGQLFGTADLVRVLGPVELADLVAASELPRQEREEFRNSGLPYAKTYAYVFSNPRRFKTPIPYRHPRCSYVGTAAGGRSRSRSLCFVPLRGLSARDGLNFSARRYATSHPWGTTLAGVPTANSQ